MCSQEGCSKPSSPFTLCAHKEANDAMKSDQREAVAAFYV